MAVILETSLGDITIDLFTEERPICCKNFLKLCKVKYYNFSLFHSVQRNLVAQTGDPTGTGRGGESINGIMYGEQARFFDMELVPRMKHRNTGTVSMVNNGGNMHGSQFFITLGENLDYLDGKHTVFGEVGEGMDILMKINEVYCDEEHRPYKDIRIYHTIVLDDPYDDPAGLEVPDKSPEPTKEQLNCGRIGAEEAIDDFEGKTEEEVKEIMDDREAKVNAEMLEVVGDIPDADVKPPENVLFVCKLNPVTSEDDLEIIFSRFGPIESCEVIKDQKTGESLQYAFVEFEKEEDCERAYFKMDNVLIDDRRIHVDFSQSVAKVKWKGKGKGVVTFDASKISEERPKFKLKDKSQPKNDKYDLILEDTIEKSSKKSKKKKHKHKVDRHGSDSEEERETKKHKHKEDRQRSNSEEERETKKHKHKEDRQRSDSEEERETKKHKHKEDRQRSDSEEERETKKQKKHKKHKHRSRSKSKSPVADRHKRRAHSRDRSPKRYRDRSPDRHRDRSPDRYRDRQRDSHRGHGTGRDRARDYRR